MKTTTNLALKKPEYTDPVDIEDVNYNMDLIDQTFTSRKADYVRHPAFAPTTGVTNAYVITTNPAPTSYVDGMSVYLDIHLVNTGASTLNWNDLGAKPIVNSKGTPLIAGKLPANCIVGVRYNASASNFQLLGEGGEYGTAGAAQTLTGYTIGTENGIIPGLMPERGTQTETLEIIGAAKPTKIIDSGHINTSTITAQLAAALAPYILNTQTIGGIAGTLVPGKKWASGTGVVDTSNMLTVMGLAFQPAYVFGFGIGTDSSAFIDCLMILSTTQEVGYDGQMHYGLSMVGYSSTFATGSNNRDVTPITSDGFSFKMGPYSISGKSIKWFAVGP